QQVLALSEDHRMGWANRRAAGLLSCRDTVVTQLALDDLGIESDPLELRHVVRTRNFTVAAANAEIAVPRHHACDCILLQPLEHASSNACRIDTMHALLLDVGVD